MADDYTIFIGTVGNGLQISQDRGESWTATPVGGPEGNVGTVAVYPDEPHRLLAGSDRTGLYRSVDNGATWKKLDSPMEGMEIWSIDVDPDTLFVGTGNTIPGEIGGIQRSRDGGDSWEYVPLPVVPNSVVYWLGTHADSPDVIAAARIFGYVYLSEDGGETWTKPRREFGHVRAVAVTPT